MRRSCFYKLSWLFPKSIWETTCLKQLAFCRIPTANLFIAACSRSCRIAPYCHTFRFPCVSCNCGLYAQKGCCIIQTHPVGRLVIVRKGMRGTRHHHGHFMPWRRHVRDPLGHTSRLDRTRTRRSLSHCNREGCRPENELGKK